MPYLRNYSKLPLARDNPMFRSKLFGIIIGIGVSIGFAEDGPSIRLDAFSGTGSILLHWETPEEASSVIIYKSTDFQKSYTAAAEVSAETDRYLDTDLTEGQTAFYYVEFVINENGSIFSDRNTPPFGEPYSVNDEEMIVTPAKYGFPEDFNLFQLKLKILSEYIETSFSSIESAHVISLPVIRPEILFQWFGFVPTDDLEKILEAFVTINNEELVSFWNQKWIALESGNRNSLLMTPDEYREKGIEIISSIVEASIPKHIAVLERDLQAVQSSNDIVFKSFLRNAEFSHISFYAMRAVKEGLLMLSSTDESLTIDLTEVIPDSVIKVEVPFDWETVRVAFNGQTLGSNPILLETGMKVRFLDGTFSTGGSLNPFPISRSVQGESPYWINEIQYNPQHQSLTVEIAGKSDFDIEYGLFINDELLWEIQPGIQFEEIYHDSAFMLNTENRSGSWLDLKMKVDGRWSVEYESRPIIFDALIIEARIPDGGAWQEITFTTFGEANDFRASGLEQQVIPEVFALFQNFPNPFNASTSVSIDLIEPAIIDLFITDAGGRKIKDFVRSEALTPGQYSFVWDAHDHSSGVYFLTIVAQMEDYLPVVQSRKMIYLK